MNFDNLFVDTVEDLRRRCHLRASEYDMVQAAGLIRRLTIDKHSLWELVNREHRLVIQCVWNDVAVAHRSGAFISTLWLDPALWEVKADAIVPAELRTELPSAVRTSSIPQFLKAVVVSRELAEVSVHQLVKHYANREGGVHYDAARAADSPLLEDVRGDGDEALRLTVVAIGRVLVRALEPLVARVLLARRPHPHGLYLDGDHLQE